MYYMILADFNLAIAKADCQIAKFNSIQIFWLYNLSDFCRNVKASSPWMNVILLSGILLRLPVSIYGGLIFSGYKYAGLIGVDFTILCHVS